MFLRRGGELKTVCRPFVFGLFPFVVRGVRCQGFRGEVLPAEAMLPSSWMACAGKQKHNYILGCKMELPQCSPRVNVAITLSVVVASTR